LAKGNFPGWEISSQAVNVDASISWYIAGTPADWLGTPFVLVIALEDGQPVDARKMGRELFLTATSKLK